MSMLRNYLTVGFRALAKNRTYALINIAGLAIGMAACLMILLFVRYELSYDRWLPGADSSYLLETFVSNRTSGGRNGVQGAPYAAGPALVKDFPEITAMSFMLDSNPIIMDKGEPDTAIVTMVDADFFKIFPVHFSRGSAAASLADMNSVALSTRAAQRYFGSADPIGRILTVIERGEPVNLRVGGVFDDIPKNSHAEFSIVRRFNMATGLDPQAQTQWGWITGKVYVKLRPGADIAAVNARLPAWSDRNAPKENINGQILSQADGYTFRLVALPDIHLGEAQQGADRPGNDRGTIVTFAIVAVLILGMACVNFTNLATARASQRAREVALRKVLGASRRQLIVQFLGESILIATIAMMVGAALVELALPWFAHFLDADLQLHYIGAGGLLLPMIGLVLLVGVAGGLYPAFFLSRFQPAHVLKANKSASDTPGSGRLRNMLVVVQFAISIGLIICTAVVYMQTIYVRQADTGFRREGLLQIGGLNRKQLRPVTDTLKQQVGRIPGVTSVARTSIGLDTNNRSNNTVFMPGRADPLTIGSYSVEPGFFETMGIGLVSGRTLSDRVAFDDTGLPEDDAAIPAAETALVARGLNVVINELAVRRMGFTNAGAAIGQHFGISLVDSARGIVPATIVGVVRDTRWRSLREQPDAIVYFRNDSNLNYLEVRISSPAPIAVRNAVEQVWKRLVPQVPFSAEFVDQRAANLYKADEARGQMFAAFAILSVIVGCLGLFGLAAFTAERRTKEIGIRKVLGARTRDIVQLLVWQFSKPVIVANIIAWPIAWWIMRGWLNNFDARVTLGPAPFLLAGALALLIAVGTVAGHAFRIASANPIKALRYE